MNAHARWVAPTATPLVWPHGGAGRGPGGVEVPSAHISHNGLRVSGSLCRGLSRWPGMWP